MCKGSEWQNVQVKDSAAVKKMSFEEWLQKRYGKAYDRYREVKRRVERVGREAKWRVSERLARASYEHFLRNKKMFLKEVQKVKNWVLEGKRG